MGYLGITNLCHIVASEYEASVAITEPLVRQIATQTHELPEDDATRALQQCKGRDKDARHREDLEEVKNAFPEKNQESLGSTCECGDFFGVDHAMVCRHGGFIFQRHDGLRDLEAEMLNKVCNDVQIEPVLQEISGEELTPSANKAADARLHIRARGLWERQGSAFLDVRVC